MKDRSNAFARMIKNAYKPDGRLLDLKNQIKKMYAAPSTFGYGVINVNNSLYFADINSKIIYFTKKDLSHIKEHIPMTKIIELLNDLDKEIVLGLDYYDKKTKSERKCFILDNHDYIYLLSLRNAGINEYKITELTSLFYKGFIDTFDMEHYLKSILSFRLDTNSEYKNYIYKNKKSNGFLSRFLDSCKGVNNISITNQIIAYSKTKLSCENIMF